MLLITKKKEEGILGYKTHIMVSHVIHAYSDLFGV
jgi:hypothetical protein